MALLDFNGQIIDIDEQLRDIERVNCEESLYEFMVAAWKYIDPNPFVDGWPLEAVAEHLQAVCDGDIRRLIINIPPRCSKPVRHDALVLTKEDGLIPLSSVRIGHNVLTHKGRFRPVTAVHRQGILPTFKLKTRRGRVTYAAGDHPYLTPDGWQELKNISADDVVGTIPNYGDCGRPTVSVEEARLLGYLIGDGSCRSTPNVTVADDAEADDIHRVIKAVGFESTERSYRMANTGCMLRRINIKAPSNFKHTRTKNSKGPVLRFLEKHGIANCNSYNKMIPDCIMQGTAEIVCSYIGAYWSCDGFVTTRGAKRDGVAREDLLIGCDSVNYEMLRQMQTLLLRIGISATIRTKTANIKTAKQGDKYTSYSLSISQQDDCWRFASAINIIHKKGEKLRDCKKRRFDFDKTVIGESVEGVMPDEPAECICLTVAEDSSFVADGFAVHNSSMTSVAFPAWVWAQRHNSATSGPGVQFLTASFAQQLSLRDSVKTRRLLDSPWYQSLWGDRFALTSDQNTKGRFDNNKGGTRLSTSVGSALTGEGGNIIIVDDPNAAQEAFSEATIHTTIEWWDSALSTRLNDAKRGAFIVIQQRLAEDDLTGHILSKDVGDWTHLCLPMKYEWSRHSVSITGWNDPRGCDDEGESLVLVDANGRRIPRDSAAQDELKKREGALLWPERFGPKEIDLLERQLGPFAAAGQLQQRPEPAGGGVIKTDWWQPWELESYPPFDYIIASLDTAYTTKTENDFSALTVWGVFSATMAEASSNFVGRSGKRESQRDREAMFDEAMRVRNMTAGTGGSDTTPRVMLMYAWQARLELHELVEKVAQTAKRMKVDKLIIENKAAGHSVAQEIRRLYNDADFAVQLVDPKSQDKLARLYSVQHLFAEGMVHAPDHSWAQEVITQTSQFPKGKHDDLVDTVSMALRHMRELGMLTRQQERVAEMENVKRYTGKPPSPLYPV